MRSAGPHNHWLAAVPRGMALAVLALAAAAAHAAIDAPVRVTGGTVSGTAGAMPGFMVFRGIPYAAPPVGVLRWRPPAAATAWHGVRAADRFAADCPSITPSAESTAPGQSEDCLYLNVWTPARTAADKLPVMVWIYGGAFIGGSPSYPRYDGSGLNKKGVIFVSFNFRTGVLGFLAHPGLSAESPHHASGNYGLLDSVAALQWVKANIARLGGDPQRVTLFGQSSGSQMVNLLTVSPTAKGLFQRAIGESGAGFGEREPKPLAVAEAAGAAFANAFGATPAELRRTDAAALLAVAKRGMFEPVVDGWVLPADPHALLAAGRQNDIPILAGSNADESQLNPAMTRAKYEAQQRGNYSRLADRVLARFPAATDADAPLAAKRFGTLVLGDYNAGSWVAGQTRTGKSPVFQYRFVHAPPPFSVPGGPPPSSGAAHGAEIPFAFNTLDMQKRDWTATDRRVAELVSAYWTNFAKTGDPNGAGLPRWQSTKQTPGQLLELGETGRMVARPSVADFDFMEGIFYGPGGLFAPQ